MNIYLATPVRRREGTDETLEWLSREIERAGATLVNPEVAGRVPDDLETSYAAPFIHDQNCEKLKGADMLVAECSAESHGVGYEIGLAQSSSLPITCLWRSSAGAPSKMIMGSPYSRLRVLEYETTESIEPLLRVAFQAELAAREASPYVTRVREHFRSLAQAYDTTTEWRQSPAIVDWFRERLPADGTVIDVGSGTGAVCAARPGLRTVRVDMSPEMLAKGSPSYAVVANAVALPIRTASADATTIRQVLHYLPEDACLHEAARVLRDDGTLLVGQVVADDDRLARWWLELKRLVQPLRRTFYSRAHLATLLRSAGFEVVEHERRELARSDPWIRFLANTPAALHASVRAYLDNAPRDVRERIGLKFDEASVMYRQNWSLLRCRRRAASAQ